MIGGVALLAVRFCAPSKESQLIKNYDIRQLISLSNSYYLADPITFDKDLHDEFIKSNPIFLILRIVSSQFPFNPGLFSEFSRPSLLFDEIPRQLQGLPGIPPFDFEKNFQAINKVSVTDFITTGFVISAASHGNFAISRDHFKKIRKKGINLTDDSTRKVLNQLAGDKNKMIELYEKRKNKDRRFRMYDYNPLFSYPIIRPCQDKQFSNPDRDFFHAPVPELVGSRISTGIFYQMYNEYGIKFAEYFGHVFEKYVALVISKCIVSERLISEIDIRKVYPKDKGKSPDLLLIDDTTLILLECKATRFSRAAQAIASETAVNESLAQIIKGLKQLASFMSACQNNVPQLSEFHGCTQFKPVIVSLEPLHLINTPLFREHINSLLANENITNLNWQIISIDELEALQPHIAEGFRLSQILGDLQSKTFNDVLESLISQTNKSFCHSFLYPKQEELYQRLDIPLANFLSKHLC
jgi:hypothetical protein